MINIVTHTFLIRKGRGGSEILAAQGDEKVRISGTLVIIF